MHQILFTHEADISNDWLFYIENEAKSLSQRDDFAIKNYLDREIFNPEMTSYLNSDLAAEMLNQVIDTESLHLNLVEGLKSNHFPDWLRPRFRKLKVKVKEVFCGVVHEIGEIDIKGILKTILLALIPAFASGIPAVVLPIIIGLLAYLLKYGIEKTCPV